MSRSLCALALLSAFAFEAQARRADQPSTLATAASSSFAIRSNSGVYGMGGNTNGELGSPALGSYKTTPGLISTVDGGRAVAAGNLYSLVLGTDGLVYSSGQNSSGQLGDGSTTSRTSYAAVPGLSGVVAVAAGNSHSLALKEDGTVVAWGAGGSGQLGNGGTSSSSSPVAVSGLSEVVAIAASLNGSYAVTAEGELYAWGGNDYGNLGLGSFSNKSTPTLVASLADVVDVAAGAHHAMALLADGSVYAFGANYSGQIGQSVGYSTSPMLVSLGSPIRAIGTAAASSYALGSDGLVYSFGSDGSGQLCNGGANTSSSSPAPIAATAAPPVSLSVGVAGNHVLIGLANGQVVGCGNNWSGQLGNGSMNAGSGSPATLSPTW